MSWGKNVKYGIAQKYNLIDQVQTVGLPPCQEGASCGRHLFLNSANC